MTNVSVIIPVYNIPDELLKNCIDSLLFQRLENIEFIFVNDASQNSNNLLNLQECTLKDNRVKVIDIIDNGGVSNARNKGLDIAKGKYIGFVDADDTIEQSMFQTLFENVEKTNADIILCNSRCYIDKDGNSINTQNKVYEKTINAESDLLFVFQNFGLGCCDKLYKKDIIDGIRFDNIMSNYEDYHFNWRVLAQCRRVVSLPNVLYYVQFYPLSASRAPIDIKRYHKLYQSLMSFTEVCSDFYKIGYIRLAKYLFINVLLLGIMNRQIQGVVASKKMNEHYDVAKMYYSNSLKEMIFLLPITLRVLLKVRMSSAKHFFSNKKYLYFLLRIEQERFIYNSRISALYQIVKKRV